MNQAQGRNKSFRVQMKESHGSRLAASSSDLANTLDADSKTWSKQRSDVPCSNTTLGGISWEMMPVKTSDCLWSKWRTAKISLSVSLLRKEQKRLNKEKAIKTRICLYWKKNGSAKERIDQPTHCNGWKISASRSLLCMHTAMMEDTIMWRSRVASQGHAHVQMKDSAVMSLMSSENGNWNKNTISSSCIPLPIL